MITLFRRFRYWTGRRDHKNELAEELETHRAMMQERLERSGMHVTDAASASRRALGNVTLAMEDAREVWGWPSIEHIWRDARHGARMLRAQPTFAATAILTLAVGIGATTTAFTVANSELWKPLPFPGSDRLMALHTTGPDRSAPDTVSVPDFLDWRSQNQTFEALAAWRWTSHHVLRGPSGAESVRGMQVTSNFFTVLGRSAAHGRTFLVEDERTARSVMLSDGGWRRLFAADPAIVGRTITIDDRAYAVIGVTGPEPLEFIDDPDLFPVIDLESARDDTRSARDLVAFGRLQDGIDRAAAAADLQVIANRLAHDYPADHKGRGVRVDGLHEAHTGWNARPLLFFLGAAFVVLLLSCANVANLLLARALDRRREFAIRTALGGGRYALFAQLVVEGALLAIPAAAAGLLMAAWSLDAIPAWVPEGYVERGGRLALDARALLFAIAATSVTAIAFALAPSVFAGGRDLSSALTQGGRTVVGSPFERRARQALVVVEVTLALVLLVGAGLFINSFIRLTNQPLGFDTRDRLMMRIPVIGERYGESSELVQFSTSFLDRVRALPGVANAVIGSSSPLEGASSTPFFVAGRPQPAEGEAPRGLVRAVTPDYFGTLGIHRLAGRDFTAGDADGATAVAVINERLAARLFRDENPIGRRLVLQPRSNLPWVRAGAVEIVGVVANIKDVGMNEVEFNNIYLPFAQAPTSAIGLVVSTAVAPEGLAAAIRSTLHDLDPNLPIVGIETMERRVSRALRSDRFNLQLVGGFAAIAIVLAAIGIYGAMAYAIAQRTQEFGVRLALGAARANILALALGQSLRLAMIGTALGLGAALALARALGDALYLVQGQHDGLLYGVTLTDPLSLACAGAAVLAVAALAGLIPARRATRVDPAVALRAD